MISILDIMFVLNGLIYAILYTIYKNPITEFVFMVYIIVNIMCYYCFGGYLYMLYPTYSQTLFNYVMIHYNEYIYNRLSD